MGLGDKMGALMGSKHGSLKAAIAAAKKNTGRKPGDLPPVASSGVRGPSGRRRPRGNAKRVRRDSDGNALPDMKQFSGYGAPPSATAPTTNCDFERGRGYTRLM